MATHNRIPRLAWKTICIFAAIGAAGVSAYVLLGRGDEVGAAGKYLANTRWGWVTLAIALELGSMVAFAGLQRSLLTIRRKDPAPKRIGLRSLAVVTFGGNSIANSLPGGPALASVFAFKQYRRMGADSAESASVLIGVTIYSCATLVVLTLAGMAVTGGEGPAAAVTVAAAVVIIGLIAFGALLWTAIRHANLIDRPMAVVVRAACTMTRNDPHNALDATSAFLRRLRETTVSGRAIGTSLAWSLGNWVLDLGCLIVAFYAIGTRVPWTGVVLAYGAGQLAANLPITPGGLGVVEGSLSIALVVYGGSHTSTVAVVLLYRILSFWMLLPIGWTCVAALSRKGRLLLSHQAGTVIDITGQGGYEENALAAA